jgi:ribonuclease M5
MKNKVNALIVVEGQSDIDFLSSFLDCEFYKVNGSAINNKDIEFIKKAKEKQQVIILTDPDFPGMQIRAKINEKIPECYNAFVRKEVSIKNHKVGVAESTKTEVLNAIKDCKFYSQKEMGTLKTDDLFELGLIGKENSLIIRKKVCEKLGIGYCNGNTMLKRINLLNISKNEIKEAMKNVNN